jgi:stage II sporulation protein M
MINMKAPGLPEFKVYLKDLRKFIYVSVALFLIFYAAGYIMGIENHANSDSALNNYARQISPSIGQPQDVEMMSIFINNAWISLTEIVLGLLIGFWPVFYTLYFGIRLGLIDSSIVTSQGIFYAVIGTIPHGIVELPALLLSAAIGLRYGYVILNSLVLRKGGPVKKELFMGMAFFVMCILPLLFVAAFLESYITPALLQIFFGV